MNMTKQALHPSTAELRAFSGGLLTESEADAVGAHIDECQPCCETLVGLSAQDTFVELLQEAVGTDAIKTVEWANNNTANTGLAHESGLVESALAEHPRYEIIAPIAKGGMGEVFKAKHRVMDRMVALKVINSELMRKPEAVERFHREVKTAACLSHPNIVTAYDAEQAEGVHFLVMEHVDGVNLADLVDQKGKLSIADACNYAQQAALGLQYAHEQGMVHRDMKPHNLMLTTEGVVKILDFGLASLMPNAVSDEKGLPEHANLTAAGTVMGTPNFVSPEQASDARGADIRSDIYSLGATLHYLLSGQPPFAEGSVAERLRSHAELEPISITSLRDDAPEELAEIVNRMMAKSPDQRFQTPREIADALEPFIQQGLRATSAGASSWWPPTKLTAVASGVLGVLLASIIYLETDKGTLIIDSVDDSVNVTVLQAENEEGDSYLEMSVIDTLTGSQVKRLPSGKYKVSLGKEGSDYELSEGGFTLKRGDDVVVRVTRKPKTKAEQAATAVPPMDIPKMAQLKYSMQGVRLSPEEAKALQAQADSDPSDLGARLQLLSFYNRRSRSSSEYREAHQKMALWFVKNYPESYVAGSHQAHIYPSMNPDGYLMVKKMWLKQIKRKGQELAVLKNAASYFLQSEREFSEELLLRARALEPNNAEAAQQLGQLYKIGLNRLKGDLRKERAALAMAQFEIAVQAKKNKYWLGDLAQVALEAGANDKAELYANQLLQLGDTGKPLHVGNMILGRLAMQDGNVEQAKLHLLAAGKTTGGPTLNNFGPDMQLAKELLEKGEKETVLEYFQLCSKFWKNKSNQLKEWSEVIKRDEVPNFQFKLK